MRPFARQAELLDENIADHVPLFTGCALTVADFRAARDLLKELESK